MTTQRQAQLLREAAHVMRVGGLVRGARRGPGGSHCALGALDEVRGYQIPWFGEHGGENSDPLVEAVARILVLPVQGDAFNPHYSVLEAFRHFPNVRIAVWSNTAPDAEAVAAGFERVAAQLEAEAAVKAMTIQAVADAALVVA